MVSECIITYFSRKKWPKGEKIDMGMASGAVLLIFRAINKPEIRILFPGAADTNLGLVYNIFKMESLQYPAWFSNEPEIKIIILEVYPSILF